VLAALLVVGLACCENSGGAQTPVSTTPEAPSPEPRPPAPDVTRSRALMGTVYRITVADTPADQAEDAIRRAFDEMERLEDVLSEWREDSEISRINAAAGRAAVRVSDDTWAVVKAGLDVSRWSDGAFDLSWAAMRGLYDFHATHPRPPSAAEVRRRLPLVRHQDIAVDEEARTVFLRRPGMAIGTGAIGKGYALDRASDILREAGVESFMLFGGGQVQVHGKREGRPWRVGVQHPRRQDAYFGFIESTGGSISTSGDYESFFMDDAGRRWHHILDPRTGRPAEGALSVTVLAATGLYADALSTAAFVLGPERAQRMFERIPYRSDMVLVDPSCRVLTTPRMQGKLKMTLALEGEGRLPGCVP
jgi:FAD:protein FMN transferase